MITFNLATSVDIECTFSFAGSIVSKHCHSLWVYSIQATALLGLYSKAGLVKPGILILPCKERIKGKAKDVSTSEAMGQGSSSKGSKT
jgi:hypothetical protein